MFKLLSTWKSLFIFSAVDGESGGSLEGDAITDAFSSLLNPPSETELAQAEEVKQAEKAKQLAGEATEKADEAEAVDDPETADEKITIEVDGKMVELTPQQVAEAYKNGLRQDDYTRKTMAVAEERKAAETEATKTRNERNDYAQKLNTFGIQLQGLVEESQGIDFERLITEDPVQYLKQKDLLEKRQAALYQANIEYQQIQALNQSEAEQAQTSYLQTQQQELIAKLPVWKDEQKAAADKAEIKDYLKGQGFTDQDIAQVQDHRHVILLRNAMLFDKLMKEAPSAAKRVAATPAKVERPGVSNDLGDQRSKLMKQVRNQRTLSDKDADRAFAALL